MRRIRFGIFAQLISSFIIAVIFAVVIGSIGILSFDEFRRQSEGIAAKQIPAMSLAFQLGQQSENVVASAPTLARAQNQSQRETVSFRVSDRVGWLNEIIQDLKVYDVDQNILSAIERVRTSLFQNFNKLDKTVEQKIKLVELKRNLLNEVEHLFNKYKGATGLGYTIHELSLMALIYSQDNDAQSRKNIEKAFETARQDSALLDLMDFRELDHIVTAQQGVINTVDQLKDLEVLINGLLSVNERLSNRLVYSVNDLVRRLRDDTSSTNKEFQKVIEKRTLYLTGLIVASVLAVSVIGLLVITYILRRLKKLNMAVSSYSEGKDQVFEVGGNDEITEMAEAYGYLIEEINRREGALKLSEERFRDIAEATSDWFWETDRDLNYSLIADRFYEITGFSKHDVLGRSPLELWSSVGPSEDPEKWVRHRADLKNKRRFRDFTFSLRCRDGDWRQIKTSGKPVFDENGYFRGYRGTGSDITVETQARSRLMAANEIMPGAFALWDHDDRLILCNRKYYQYYKIIAEYIRPGVSFETLIKELEARCAILDEDDYAENRIKFHKQPDQVFLEAMADGRYLQVSEARTLDGGTVSLVIDVSERLETEGRLEQARLLAENANQAKSKFLAAASHDLRQPLHAIGMFLSALEDRRLKASDDEARNDLRIIGNISDSLDALRGLLNALLDISKLDAGVMKAEFSAVALQPLFDRLIKQYEARAKEKGLTLKSFCGTLSVHSDPVLLERVLSNLMSNAVRYTDEGGVLLGARLRGDKVLLEVWDTGAGIPPDKIDDIFVEFQQLHNPARDRRRGLGLGLAIVNRVLALIKHPLTVRSKVDRGSVFSLEVPLVDRLVVIPREKPIEVALTGEETPMIVVIDDEPDILRSMKELILGWKYNVIAALSSDEAMEKIRKSPEEPSLILADYRLKEERNGADAIRMIQSELKRNIPAAIITGDTAPERIQDAKNSGFVLLHKPLRPAKLRQLIRSVHAKNFPL